MDSRKTNIQYHIELVFWVPALCLTLTFSQSAYSWSYFHSISRIYFSPSHSSHPSLGHHCLSPGLLQEVHLFSLFLGTYCWHNQLSQHIVALKNNHFIVLIDPDGQEFRKDTSGQFLFCSMISGASTGMTLLARSGTARPEGSVSKMASLLPCLAARLEWLKEKTNRGYQCGLSSRRSLRVFSSK